jgi:hypothetical protein
MIKMKWLYITPEIRIAVYYRFDTSIVTEKISPPIPIRNYDWTAWIDGDEETGSCGYGENEKDAIKDLLEEMLLNGEISNAEYNKDMKDLRREYRECAQEAADSAYSDESERW